VSDDLTIRVRDEFDYVVLVLRGRLTLRNVPDVRDVTVKWLLGTGQVVIDISHLRATQTTVLTVFPTALCLAGGWPSARLVLFGANPTLRCMLNSIHIPDTVPVADDLTTARTLLDQQPPQIRRYRDLPPHYAAPAAARQFVREACADWSIPREVVEFAELVCSELVTNAVQHARSTSRVYLTCGGSAMRIAVRDYRPTALARPRPIDIAAPRGRGLHLVAAVAHSWGTDEHPDGKTIWANVLNPSDPQPPTSSPKAPVERL